MSLILNIETASEICSVALCKDNEIIAEKESAEPNVHSSKLTVFIEEIFQEASINISSLDAVAVSKGPGSYTGLRIGVSAAKGICYGIGKPLIAVSTLQSLAGGFLQNIENYFKLKKDEKFLLCPMLDARRMEVYTAMYDIFLNEIKPVTASIINEDSYIKELEKQKIIFFGNGSDKCSNFIRHENAVFINGINAHASFMAPLSSKCFQIGTFEDVAYFEPYYLKDFITTIPGKKLF